MSKLFLNGSLGRCLFYIDKSMVRAGAVEHPAVWKHTAFHEFVGNRQVKAFLFALT